MLREFNEAYEGSLTSDEEMHLALQALLKDNPGLEEKLDALPNRIFSGKTRGAPGQLLSADSNAVFFCYALPGLDRTIEVAPDSPGSVAWTEDAGRTAWYLYDLASGSITEDASQIFAHIQCEPKTPRHTVVNKETLKSVRKKVDDHIKNTYLKQTDAPIGVAPVLKAWMELS